MRDEVITSRDNPKIKALHRLMNKSDKSSDTFVIEGKKPVLEAISLNSAAEAYLSERACEDDGLLEKIKGSKITTHIISDKLYEYVTDTVTPQGILAVVNKQKTEFNYIKNKNKILFLDELRDPGNVGTIIRTAEGAGFDAVVLSKGCADIFRPKVVRSTMGSILRVCTYICETDTSEFLRRIKDGGHTLYATDLAGDTDYDKTVYEEKSVIIIGNEANGVSKDAVNMADKRIRIPMAGEVESLNAAVSAAIIMYEVKKSD